MDKRHRCRVIQLRSSLVLEKPTTRLSKPIADLPKYFQEKLKEMVKPGSLVRTPSK
jgi:hypothetical protein